MLKNYLKTAWRNLVLHKWYSILNIGGLAIGMTCAIFILLWVQNESSYDSFHENADEIFRLTAKANEDFEAAVSPVGMVIELPDEMPEIKSSLLLTKPFDALVEANGQRYKEGSIFFADENFLEFFSFPLIAGDPKTAFTQPNTIVITESTAKKYFGEDQALGQTIKINNQDSFQVTGVFAYLPTNSHLQFNAIVPTAHIANSDQDLINRVWNSFDYYGYFWFEKDAIASKDALAKTIQKINQIYANRVPDFEINFSLQSLKDIHLYSTNLQIDLPGHGNSQYVNIFLVVAFIILIVACINYMNLATARSARRAREVGLRKVIGADRGQLIFQFLGESLIISFLSLAISIGLVYLLLPAFNDLAQKELVFQLENTLIWTSLIVIALVTGLISGSYPALLLSGFKPVKVLKGRLKLSNSNLLFRNGLVISQFVVSVLLLVGTIVIYKQLNFIKDKNLGYNKSNLIYIPMEGEMWDKQEALKTALDHKSIDE